MANQASRAIAIAFGEQDPRKREAALSASGLVADEVANGSGVAALLPQERLRSLSHMFCLLGFHDRRGAVVPYSGRLMRLLGPLKFVAGPCNVV
jgi:hypothetical protein